jgi:glycosyltransferase involved in cell wall biosynthesis
VRIAHVAHTYLPASGGAESVIHHLAQHQMREHQPTVIVRWNRWRSAFARLGYPILPLLPTTLRRAPESDTRRSWRALVKVQIQLIQRRNRFDIWHFHNSYPDGWAMAPLLEEMGIATVFTSHGGDLPLVAQAAAGPAEQHRARRAAEACTRFTGVVAISGAIERYLHEVGVDPSRIRRIANGVDAVRLGRGSGADRAAARRELGVDGNVLLTVANETHHKGADLIPAIAETLGRSTRDFTWLIVGPTGPKWAARLPPNIRLLPRRQPKLVSPLLLPTAEMVTLYRAADIQVVPSRVEGLPLAVLEGMAAGLPMVSTDAPGCIDLVAHGANGLVSPVDDVAAMATNIARLISRPEERADFGETGKRLALAYDWETIAPAYEAFYREVLARRRRDQVGC